MLAGLVVSTTHAQTSELPDSSVGMPVQIEQLVLPGPELEPTPVTDETPVIIRIDAVYPHGSDFRYDLTYYGLEPGEYDLRDFLRRKDGSSVSDLPELPITVESLLPPGQVEPHGLEFSRLPWLGGYRLLMILAGVLWVAAMVWVLYPRRKSAATATAVVEEPPSLADRLRPLVTDAMAGRLPAQKLAELERALVQYWRRRLRLEELPPSQALAELRAHPEASPLLTQLETWLHRPPGDQQVDVNALLEPYQHVAAEDLEATEPEQNVECRKTNDEGSSKSEERVPSGTL